MDHLCWCVAHTVDWINLSTLFCKEIDRHQTKRCKFKEFQLKQLDQGQKGTLSNIIWFLLKSR